MPAKVYCDNGAVFQSRQFALVCANLGIRHLSARPYAPEGRGKVERFYVKFRIMRSHPYRTLNSRRFKVYKLYIIGYDGRGLWAGKEQGYYGIS